MSRRSGTPVLVNGSSRSLQRLALMPGAGHELSESWLQQLIFENPECLPMVEIEPGFDSLVAICREMPTGHGPIDNLFMTGSGDIVIVETKLWRNPEARRTVLAQALDYATCLFQMSYSEFQQAALRGRYGSDQRPESLYAVMSNRPDTVSEQAFVDAVSFNLHRGRIVVLVVGDGIRSETERLAEGLQAHAGFHFTFALVELAMYTLPDDAGIVVVPRTLARTTLIERGIVRIEGGQISISPPAESIAPVSQPSSISAEQFFDAMRLRDQRLPSALKRLINKLEPFGVYPDFRKSLNFKWDSPEGRTINLGYISRNGEVWTDVANSGAPIALSHRYIEDLAALWGLDVEREKLAPNWHVRLNGKAPRIESLLDKLEDWCGPVARFVDALRGERVADVTALEHLS